MSGSAETCLPLMEVQGGMFPVHRDLQITEAAGQLDRPITPACQVRFISAAL